MDCFILKLGQFQFLFISQSLTKKWVREASFRLCLIKMNEEATCSRILASSSSSTFGKEKVEPKRALPLCPSKVNEVDEWE